MIVSLKNQTICNDLSADHVLFNFNFSPDDEFEVVSFTGGQGMIPNHQWIQVRAVKPEYTIHGSPLILDLHNDEYVVKAALRKKKRSKKRKKPKKKKSKKTK
jgi:hypothetical protein